MAKSDEIFSMWVRRDVASRPASDVVELADDAWRLGFKLSDNPAIHYQQVMQLLRFSIIERR